MSLIVYPYRRDAETNEMIFLDEQIQAPYNDIFGFESWRYSVWGSSVLAKLNCNILNTLKDTNIYAEGVDLDKLESEFSKILNSLENIHEALQVSPNLIKVRVENGIEAIRVAKTHAKGGVVIS